MTKTPNIARFVAYAAIAVTVLVLWRLFGPATGIDSAALNEGVRALWSRPYFTIGILAVTPLLLIKAVVYLALLWAGTKVVSGALRTRLLDRTNLDEGQKFSLQRVAAYLFFTLGAVIGLQSAGIDLSSVTVFSGALGIGVGLGFQTIAKNFASGLVLLVERPIKVGDRVQLEDLLGDIMHIGSRGTWVKTNDNIVMIVPNSEFVEGRVTNWTANDRRVRINIPVGVSYASDPEHVREVLLRVAREHADVLNVPGADVIFTGFGDSSLDFELRVWTTKQVTTPRIIASDVYFKVFAAFRKERIEIPFPQRDLHLRSVSSPVPISGGKPHEPELTN